MGSATSSQPSPYSDGQVGLKPGELEIRLTTEQMRSLIDEVVTLRRATSVAVGQSPMLDRLVNTLVLEYAQMTGTALVFEAEQVARR